MASKVQEGKLPTMVGDVSTLRPFWKAFYLGKASYFRLESKLHTSLHSIKTFIATLHAFPLLLGLHSAAVILHDWSFEERDYSYKGKNYPFAVLYTV